MEELLWQVAFCFLSETVQKSFLQPASRNSALQLSGQH